MSDDWLVAKYEPQDKLARLHHFSFAKPHGEGEVEFLITVREYGPSADESRRFVARTDRQTNQRTAAYTPTGWGATLLQALGRCVREIHRFPYEGD